MGTTTASKPGVFNPDERRLVLAVCVVVGVTSVISATYNFVLNPMLSGLHASESQTSMLRQLPSISVLLVIFVAGSLGARLGQRRVMSVASARR